MSTAQHIGRQIEGWIIAGLLAFIRGYQFLLSPWVGRQCRFYPTCSHYAAEALQVHGLISGMALIFRRLSRCHPFNPGGVDDVPPVCTSACAEHHT